MIRLIFTAFFRSGSARLGLSFIILAGFIGLLVGKQHLAKLNKNIKETTAFHHHHLQQTVKYHSNDLGLVMYYAKFTIVNQPLALNGLAIGQRDLHPSVRSVNIRTLEAQKYDSDLNNPYNLYIGNIDFSFVLIYLFPLLILSFCYNILSEQEESGTWKIASVQAKNPLLFLLQLFSVRIISVIAACVLLLFSGAVIMNAPVDNSFFPFVITSLSYLLVWFAIAFWVVSWKKSSGFNAVALLSIWLLMVVLLPAALNNYLLNKYQVPEALETTLQQRKAYHEKWDMDKQVTMDKFYAHYPQFKKYPLPDKNFSWLWYYAMQQMGDDESQQSAQKMKKKLKQRECTSELLSWFVPALHVQHQLNVIAKADLSNHLLFLDSISGIHEKQRLHFYPKIFAEQPVSGEDWGSYPVETFSAVKDIHWPAMLLPPVLYFLLFAGLGWRRIMRREKKINTSLKKYNIWLY